MIHGRQLQNRRTSARERHDYIYPTTTIDDVSPSATVITATGVAINASVPF